MLNYNKKHAREFMIVSNLIILFYLQIVDILQLI